MDDAFYAAFQAYTGYNKLEDKKDDRPKNSTDINSKMSHSKL